MSLGDVFSLHDLFFSVHLLCRIFVFHGLFSWPEIGIANTFKTFCTKYFSAIWPYTYFFGVSPPITFLMVCLKKLMLQYFHYYGEN